MKHMDCSLENLQLTVPHGSCIVRHDNPAFQVYTVLLAAAFYYILPISLIPSQWMKIWKNVEKLSSKILLITHL